MKFLTYINKGFNPSQRVNLINTLNKSINFYSTSPPKNINDSFNDGNIVIYLPAIASALKCEENVLRIKSDQIPDFVVQLFNVFKGLDKENLTYKFDFSLYLHTNDKNIKVDDLFPTSAELSMYHQLDDFEFKRVYKGSDVLTKNYNYHGYHVFKSIVLDLNVDYDKLYSYIIEIYKSLTITAHEYNKDISDEKGLIENQYRFVLCKITKIAKR